jgi:hypothetical protein
VTRVDKTKAKASFWKFESLLENIYNTPLKLVHKPKGNGYIYARLDGILYHNNWVVDELSGLTIILNLKGK